MGKVMTLDELDRMAADTGCSEHNDCLTCPLPDCIYVAERNVNRNAKKRRELIRQMATSNSASSIANQLGVHIRTVQRALKET
ncbi:hypothetical protein LCGC14_0408650 [marine sediment metagenome]|uniref:Uncharacterized protein n=1 Tax=marine sediment metagenome TaxID=412755 RepID=A0A0F9W3I3_9ZZZZ